MTSAEATPRPGFVRRCYDWILKNAEGRRAWTVMALIAFAESSFFPFPPDILLVPMLLADRRRALLLGLWCTVWSVLGGMLGYAIGSVLYDSVGHWLVTVYGMGGGVEQFREAYKHYGALIVLQGLTPIPYKLVTISSGFAGMNFGLFVLLSTVTRGVRFIGEATLFYFFGDQAKVFLEKYLTLALIVLLILVIGGFVAVKFIFAS
jgi:membrane protein YqaA with SNARE-associated domain